MANSARNLITSKASDHPKRYAFQIPKDKLNEEQQQIIDKIFKDLSLEKEKDVIQILNQPQIQKRLKSEFCMTDHEINNLAYQLRKTCQDFTNFNSGLTRVRSYSHVKTQVKQQPLSILQQKELDHFLELDYSDLPVQPCVRSLYYISKIAQTQQVNIIVPPTILIGFNYDNRMMYNCQKSGNLIVQSGFISPKMINKFINKHMLSYQQEQSLEDRVIFPQFIIRLGSVESLQNETKIYYSKESLMSDLYGFWGQKDFAVQLFIKQKHPRPSINRYYMKNGHVYKAVSISNQENLTKKSNLYKTMSTIIEEQRFKAGNLKQKQRPRSQYQRRDAMFQSQSQQSFFKDINAKKKAIENQKNNQDLWFLNNQRLNELYNSYHTQIAQRDLQKYFTVSSDNNENLSMMNCRPSCQPSAEKMTQDLLRLFGSYYIQVKKFGNISHFVCDFIEDESGLIYLLQVKSIECEGVKYDWQIQQNNLKTTQTLKNIIDKETLDEQESRLLSSCKTQIVCQDKFKEIKDYFKQVCIEFNFWDFEIKSYTTPRISRKVLERFFQEIDIGKENFILQSEMSKICPLYPLVTFTDFKNNASNIAVDQETQDEQNDQDQQPCCLHCLKIIEFYNQRYYTLVFKTEQTREELRKLKLKLYTQWTYENVKFLLKIYKDSKTNLNIASDIERHQRKVQAKLMKDRVNKGQSVAQGSLIKILEQQRKSNVNLGKQQSYKSLAQSQSNNKQFRLIRGKSECNFRNSKQNERSSSTNNNYSLIDSNIKTNRLKTLNEDDTSGDKTSNFIAKQKNLQMISAFDKQGKTISETERKVNNNVPLNKNVLQSNITKQSDNLNDKELNTLMNKYNLKMKQKYPKVSSSVSRNLINVSSQHKTDAQSKTYQQNSYQPSNFIDGISSVLHSYKQIGLSQKKNNSKQVQDYFNVKRSIYQGNEKAELAKKINLKSSHSNRDICIDE